MHSSIEEKRQTIIVPGLSGLRNIGNTCYLNSALQCLLATDSLRNYLIIKKKSDEPNNNIYEPNDEDIRNNVIKALMKFKNCEAKDLSEDEINKFIQNSFTYKLSELFAKMYNENCSIAPAAFRGELVRHNRAFAGMRHQDSQECLTFIINKLHDETKTDANMRIKNMSSEYKQYMDYYIPYQKKFNIINNLYEAYKYGDKKKDIEKNEETSNKYRNQAIQLYREHINFKKDKVRMDLKIGYLHFWENDLKNNHSVITQYMKGVYLHSTECEQCNTITNQFESYTIIPVTDLQEKETLEGCLDNYFEKREPLTEDNKYDCYYCNQKTNATKKTELWSAPPTLVIQLERFKFNSRNGRSFKIDKNIKFPINNLNISKYFNKNANKTCVYDLYGVIMHHGNTDHGHYVAYTKNSVNNEWYHYDDNHVLHIDKEKIEDHIQNGSAYILLYKIQQ